MKPSVKVVKVDEKSLYSQTLQTRPYVIVAEIDGFEYGLNSFGLPSGNFETEAEAEAESKISIEFDVVVVLKNLDFTEGRGPMVFHKVFKTAKEAEDYVSSRQGIYGSAQYSSRMVYGIHGGRAYSYRAWNGYEIKFVKFS